MVIVFQEPAVKLSYAQMAQRAKERAEKEAGQRTKDQDDPSSTSPASKDQTSTSSSSAATSSASVATRPQTLRESTANRLPQRSSEQTFRKDRDREEFRDLPGNGRGGPAPYSARRAKENRGEARTTGRDFYPPPRAMVPNGDRENFRDNRDRPSVRRRPDYYDSPPQQRIAGANRQ